MGDCGVFFQTADCGMADKYGFKAGKKLWERSFSGLILI